MASTTIGMRGGRVGANQCLDRLRLAEDDPPGSFSLQKFVEDFGWEDELLLFITGAIQ